MVIRRPENQRVAELQIQGDQAPAFRSAHFDHRAVRRSPHALFRHRCHIMVSLAQHLDGDPSKILVQLQPQSAVSNGISTYRSRDISAP